MARILCISDTHGNLPELYLDGIDCVLHAGDFTLAHKQAYTLQFSQFGAFCDWARIILDKGVDFFFTLGNHETFWEKFNLDSSYNEVTKHCLLTSGYHTIWKGYVITGLEYTNRFYDWAFNTDDTEDGMGYYCNLISPDVNILVSHGPPYGVLDLVKYGKTDLEVSHAGSKMLAKRISELKSLRLNCFGHLHFQGGRVSEVNGVKFVNASILDDSYAVHKHNTAGVVVKI